MPPAMTASWSFHVRFGLFCHLQAGQNSSSAPGVGSYTEPHAARKHDSWSTFRRTPQESVQRPSEALAPVATGQPAIRRSRSGECFVSSIDVTAALSCLHRRRFCSMQAAAYLACSYQDSTDSPLFLCKQAQGMPDVRSLCHCLPFALLCFVGITKDWPDAVNT